MKENFTNITNVLLFKHFSLEMLTVDTDNASAPKLHCAREALQLPGVEI